MKVPVREPNKTFVSVFVPKSYIKPDLIHEIIKKI